MLLPAVLLPGAPLRGWKATRPLSCDQVAVAATERATTWARVLDGLRTFSGFSFARRLRPSAFAIAVWRWRALAACRRHRRGHGVQRAACSPFFKRGCRASCRRLAASTPRPPTAPLDKPTPLRRCRVSCRVSAAGSARMHTHHTARSAQHAARVTQRTPGPRDSSEAPATSLGRLQSHGVKLCSPRPRDRGRRSRSAPRTLPCPGRYIPKPSLRS